MPAFLDRFVARVRALRVGDPLSPDTEVGPLINPGEVDRVESWVTEAAATQRRSSREERDDPRRSWSRRFWWSLRRTHECRERKYSAPCAVCTGSINWTRLFDRANSLPVAFQASVFANDIDVAMHAADRLDASAVMINDHTAFRADWMPFAGRRESGYGVGGIPFSMREMTQERCAYSAIARSGARESGR